METLLEKKLVYGLPAYVNYLEYMRKMVYKYCNKINKAPAKLLFEPICCP